MLRRTAAALALGISAALAVAPAASADTQAFVFESFEADYYLGVDADGRSTLTTVETLVAVFPEFDQNRGIRRALVRVYDGHPTDIGVVSVTDENGDPRPWHDADEDESSGDDDFHEIVIADRSFVHGRQTYVITYTQHNVTKYFADTGATEFYWDTNGTGWAQPFGSVSARVHVAPELAGSLTGAMRCYQGYEGSSTQCEITASDQPDGGVTFSAAAQDLQGYENMSVVIAFEPTSITPRDASYLAGPYGWLQLISIALTLLGLVLALVLRATLLRDARGRPTIIAEYTPPKGMTLVEAAVILKNVKRAAAAQLVDFAVRRNIRILESQSTSWFSSKEVYVLELVSDDDVNAQEGGFLRIFFGRALVPGSQYRISKTDTTRGQRVYRHVETVKKNLSAVGVRARIGMFRRLGPLLLASAGAAGAFVFAILLLEDARGGWWPFLPVPIAALVVFAVIAMIFRVPLTATGAELRDHLRGLELYIRLAEADRLRVLQSPEGAERSPISTSDPRELVKLYERLLPYAVLWGLEERWAEEIGRYYEDGPPDWYSGSGTFSAAVFASSIGSLSSSTASSFSGSSSSSSSGGSSGGGSSGGGGGGGGGGGV